jgi:hypothetical protein
MKQYKIGDSDHAYHCSGDYIIVCPKVYSPISGKLTPKASNQ